MEALKQALQAYRVPADLRWVWEGPGQGTTLENSWTDIVKSHSVPPLDSILPMSSSSVL